MQQIVFNTIVTVTGESRSHYVHNWTRESVSAGTGRTDTVGQDLLKTNEPN